MNPCNNIASSGVIIVTLAFAFVAAGGQNLSCLIVGMILLDLGNRAALVGNQTRIYALRPEARSRLNTVVSYFLGGASGAILGGLGAHLDAWIGGRGQATQSYSSAPERKSNPFGALMNCSSAIVKRSSERRLSMYCRSISFSLVLSRP